MLQFDGIAASLDALPAKGDKTACKVGLCNEALPDAQSLGCLQRQEPTLKNLPRA